MTLFEFADYINRKGYEDPNTPIGPVAAKAISLFQRDANFTAFIAWVDFDKLAAFIENDECSVRFIYTFFYSLYDKDSYSNQVRLVRADETGLFKKLIYLPRMQEYLEGIYAVGISEAILQKSLDILRILLQYECFYPYVLNPVAIYGEATSVLNHACQLITVSEYLDVLLTCEPIRANAHVGSNRALKHAMGLDENAALKLLELPNVRATIRDVSQESGEGSRTSLLCAIIYLRPRVLAKIIEILGDNIREDRGIQYINENFSVYPARNSMLFRLASYPAGFSALSFEQKRYLSEYLLEFARTGQLSEAMHWLKIPFVKAFFKKAEYYNRLLYHRLCENRHIGWLRSLWDVLYTLSFQNTNDTCFGVDKTNDSNQNLTFSQRLPMDVWNIILNYVLVGELGADLPSLLDRNMIVFATTSPELSAKARMIEAGYNVPREKLRAESGCTQFLGDRERGIFN